MSVRNIALVIALSFFITHCNLYESDAHKFINDNGQFENGKIVLASTSIFSQGYCQQGAFEITPESSFQELDHGTMADSLQWSIYAHNDKKLAATSVSQEDSQINCDFELTADIQQEKTIQHLLDKSLEIFEAAQ